MDPKDKWSCTNTTAVGLFKVETALFTLRTLKMLLDDKSFGVLIMDSCLNYLKTGRDVFGILGKDRKPICENGDPLKCLDPDRIVMVIGGDSSGTTRQVCCIIYSCPINFAYLLSKFAVSLMNAFVTDSKEI